MAAIMVVGAGILELHLHGVRSLKEKRGIIKPLIAQLQKKFNVAVAEVGLQDVWQSATLGVSVVSTTTRHAEEMLENIALWVEQNRPDIDLIEHSIETIHI